MRFALPGWVALAAACGGAPTPADGSKRAEPSAAQPAADAAGPATTAPQKRSPCADGSCTECGEGVCPSGYFCVDNKGKKGCAWLAGCVDKPACGCVSKALPACSCKDDAGVARVTCGG